MFTHDLGIRTNHLNRLPHFWEFLYFSSPVDVGKSAVEENKCQLEFYQVNMTLVSVIHVFFFESVIPSKRSLTEIFLRKWFLFTLLIVFFVVQKLLSFIRSHLFIFAFISNILGGGS